MPNLEESVSEILRDLNVTIADTETALGEVSSQWKAVPAIGTVENHFKRAIGQLKAARASLIEARRATSTVTSRKAS